MSDFEEKLRGLGGIIEKVSDDERDIKKFHIESRLNTVLHIFINLSR